MKKIRIFMTLVFLLSLLLPYAYTIDSSNFKLESVTGFEFMKAHYLPLVLLFLVLLLWMFARKSLPTLKNSCEVAIILIVLYIYSIPFHGTGFNLPSFSQIVTVLKDGLAIGYYISFLLLLSLGLSYYRLRKHP